MKNTLDNKEHILAKWLSGEISDNELVASEGEEVLKELKQVTEEVDQWLLPSYDTEAGYQKMKDRIKLKPSSVPPSKWPKILVLILAGSLIGLGLIMWLGNKKEKVKAASGETINYAFHDGSEVWLNDGSSIEYNTEEWSSHRAVELEGEALFEVNKGAPFTVKTVNGLITVLGTQFNVNSWGKKLHVECYEGKVQVQSGDQTTVLTANESVYVIDGKMRAIQNINNATPAWQQGELRFYEDQLTTVCDELERQYQITVDLKASDRIFTGSFREGDLEKALRNICKPLGLNYTISPDNKTVVIE